MFRIRWGILIALFLISNNLSAQGKKVEIIDKVEQFFQSLSSHDYITLIDDTYPRLFEVIPKEQLYKALQVTYDNPDFVTTIENAEIRQISTVGQIEGIYYALVSYTFQMTMRQKNPDVDPEVSARTVNFYQERYGAGNVQYDDSLKAIIITPQNDMFALLDPQFDGWKFLEKKDSLMPRLMKILPRDIAEAFP